jgi:predicted nuclease with TOPRIM domain
MTIAFIIALVAALVLGIAFYFQLKASHKQADEQQQLLADYQQRVDEQQKLLDDYRALEKNFDSVGQGYEQALLAFDKMEEEKQKLEQTNNKLEQRCHDLQEQTSQLTTMAHKNYDIMQQLVKDAEDEGGTPKIMAAIRKMENLTELGSQSAINTGEHTTPRQIAEQSVSESGIREANYLQIDLFVNDEANEATLRTTPRKAARVIATYNLQGQPVPPHTRGLLIQRMSNGTSRKVLVE